MGNQSGSARILSQAGGKKSVIICLEAKLAKLQKEGAPYVALS